MQMDNQIDQFHSLFSHLKEKLTNKYRAQSEFLSFTQKKWVKMESPYLDEFWDTLRKKTRQDGI